jgi:hypothetical protein
MERPPVAALTLDGTFENSYCTAGHRMNRVGFCYGLLGRIDSGRVELRRVEVGPQQGHSQMLRITE